MIIPSGVRSIGDSAEPVLLESVLGDRSFVVKVGRDPDSQDAMLAARKNEEVIDGRG